MSNNQTFVTTSKVKLYAKERHNGVRVGLDFLEGLNELVQRYIDDAVKRLEEDKRSTLKRRDIQLQFWPPSSSP